jgi:hypothetical protein
MTTLITPPVSEATLDGNKKSTTKQRSLDGRSA